MNLQDINMAHVMLNQSLLGVISSNFRMVAASFSDHKWKTRFWLEKEDVDDLEEINDAMITLDILTLDIEKAPLKIEFDTEICIGMLPSLDRSVWRILFLRREL